MIFSQHQTLERWVRIAFPMKSTTSFSFPSQKKWCGTTSQLKSDPRISLPQVELERQMRIGELLKSTIEISSLSQNILDRSERTIITLKSTLGISFRPQIQNWWCRTTVMLKSTVSVSLPPNPLEIRCRTVEWLKSKDSISLPYQKGDIN